MHAANILINLSKLIYLYVDIMFTAWNVAPWCQVYALMCENQRKWRGFYSCGEGSALHLCLLVSKLATLKHYNHTGYFSDTFSKYDY